MNENLQSRKKIAFFVNEGMDSFIGDIINGLLEEYETKKIVVTDYKQINEGMQWADICWFEWCDGLVSYASKQELAKEKKIICRLHSYEAFTNYIYNVNWDSVDKLITVCDHIKDFIIEKLKFEEEKIIVIPNGIEINKWSFKERKKGFNIAYVGYLNYKKGPMLLLHTFKNIYDKDHRYKLYIAGKFQDDRYVLYFKQMIKEFGLEDNVVYEGWQNDLDKWFEDKNYILCTSVLESQNISIMQAMCKGIKPLIHNFVGAKKIYMEKYVWNTIDESINMINAIDYNSKEYRDFIEEKYLLSKQIKKIKLLLNEIERNEKKINYFNCKNYWNSRLNNRFDIEGVGYIGLGKIYNNFLYENRINILDYIYNNLFLKEISVLELGPGIGIFTDYFDKKGVTDYYAIDIVEKSVNELSNRYKNYKFKNGDVSDFDNYDSKYDLVFAADVLLHVTDEKKYENSIENIAKSLKDEGICIVLDPISTINTKSESEHVVIRNKDYVENILDRNGLELMEFLPITFFMNYPFDRKLIGDKSDVALFVFNLINSIYSRNDISDEDKILLGKYLMIKENQMLLDNNFGLSEKILIIKKKSNKLKYEKISLMNIFDFNKIKQNMDLILKEIEKKNIAKQDYFIKLNQLLKILEQDERITPEYIVKTFNEFIPYSEKNFDEYDFESSKIYLGKVEKFIKDRNLIEFILENKDNEKIIINNIWWDVKNNKFKLPKQIDKSKNNQCVMSFIEDLLKLDANFKNNIAGFIFDENIIEDVKKNFLVYNWERAMPASQFMPLRGYLLIAERYIFASQFINKDSKVLEAPCGFGYGAAYFSKMANTVEAVDLAEDSIVFGKSSYPMNNINWSVGDVTALNYENDEFDLYVSFEVFEHLPLELVEKYLEESYRVIKKGGKFIISTPNREMRKNVNNPFHIKEYTFQEFSNLLQKYFSDVEYYSVTNAKVKRGMDLEAFNMIAVCQK